MPTFVPVTDVEKPRIEQSLNDKTLAPHRHFDNPHSLAKKRSNNPDQPADRGWAQGEVGWGVLKSFGADERDNSAQILRHATGDNKMVKNSKGLWMKAKELTDLEKSDSNSLKSLGRGNRGISVIDQLLHANEDDDKEPADSYKEFTKVEENDLIKAKYSDYKKDTYSRESNRERDRIDYREGGRRDSRERNRRDGRERDRRDSRERERRDRRDSRERDRRDSRRRDRRDSHERGRRNDKRSDTEKDACDRHNDSSSQSSERNVRRKSRNDKRRDRSSSRDSQDSWDSRKRVSDRENRQRHRRDNHKSDRRHSREHKDNHHQSRRKSFSRDRGSRSRSRSSSDRSQYDNRKRSRRDNDSVSLKEERLDTKHQTHDMAASPSVPDIKITAVQIINRFHEVFSAKGMLNALRVKSIGELFSSTASISSLKNASSVYLSTHSDIVASFQKTFASPVVASKRIFFESSKSPVTLVCDLHRPGTAPGLGDSRKCNALLYSCTGSTIAKVWGMVDSDLLSENKDLTFKEIRSTKLWSLIKEKVLFEWREIASYVDLDSDTSSFVHFHNYDHMEVWG